MIWRNMKRLQYPRIGPAWIVLALALLLIGGVNRFASRSLPEEPDLRLADLLDEKMPAEAEPVYRELLAADPSNLDLNVAYILNHFKIAANQAPEEADQAFVAHFSELAAETGSRDIGLFGQGFIQAGQNDYERALHYYRQVADRDQKYLNYAMGTAYLKLGKERLAEVFFWREIRAGGDLAGTVPGLVSLYFRQGRLDKVEELAADRSTAPFIPLKDRRKLAVVTREPALYLALVFIQPLQRLSLEAILVALLAGAAWLGYLRRVDIFAKKPAWNLAGALLLGAGAALASVAAGEGLREILPLSFGINWRKDLLFSIFYIGLLEETLKFLPVVFVLALARRTDRCNVSGSPPFDPIFYGSLSALGFATLENAFYFNRHGIGISASRFVFSTTMHLAMTAIACYPLARARFLRRGHRLPALLAGVMLAALTHGLFDFFLLGSLRQLSILSLLILILAARAYQRMIRNTLNLSPFVDERMFSSARLDHYGWLFSATAILFTLVFLYYHFNFSTAIANRQLISLLLLSMPVLLGGFGALGRIRLEPGRLVPVIG